MGYRSRVPKALLQDLPKHSYFPDTVRRIKKHGPPDQCEFLSYAYQAVAEAGRSGHSAHAMRIAHHYCLTPEELADIALETGDLTILKWLRSIGRDVFGSHYAQHAYMHTDIMEWMMQIHPVYMPLVGSYIASVSEAGQRWCIANGLESTLVPQRALMFALLNGIYDEEYILSYCKVFSPQCIFSVAQSNVVDRIKRTKYWYKLMPKIMLRVDWTIPQEFIPSICDTIVVELVGWGMPRDMVL